MIFKTVKRVYNSLTLPKIIEMGSAEREIERQKKLKILLDDINSNDEKKIIAAIKALKVNGDESVIRPLVQMWNNNTFQSVQNELAVFFNDLKSNSSASILMEIINDEHYNKVRLPLLSSIWNSSVDYSEYLEDFVRLAIHNDFMIALECLTIIENLEGPFEEHHVLESEIALREYAEQQNSNKTDDDQKLHLIREIELIISSVKFQ